MQTDYVSTSYEAYNSQNKETFIEKMGAGLQLFAKNLFGLNLPFIWGTPSKNYKGAFTNKSYNGSLASYINKYNFYDKMPYVNMIISNNIDSERPTYSWAHFLTWHGFDGNTHIVFDPYGRISKYSTKGKLLPIPDLSFPC